MAHENYCRHGFHLATARCPRGCRPEPPVIVEDPGKKEETARQYLDIRPEQNKRQTNPLPRWLSCENIAMLLTLPHVIFTDYEQNKNNSPRTTFVTPTAAVDHPSWKKRKADRTFGKIDTITRAKEESVPGVGAEIIQKDVGVIITIAEIKSTTYRRARLPMPPDVLPNFTKAKQALEEFNNGPVPDKTDKTATRQYKAARRSLEREVTKWRDLKDVYEAGKWGEIPVGGRPSFEIKIPPRPEGCSPVFAMRNVGDYIRQAWQQDYRGDDTRTDWDQQATGEEYWQVRWPKFENSVIRRAWVMKVFNYWSQNLAQRMNSRKALGEVPIDLGWVTEYKDVSSGADWSAPRFDRPETDIDSTARDTAAIGYDPEPDGFTRDETIRHNNNAAPGSKKYGKGASADTDDKDDMHGYERAE